jgi:DNA-binding SARP family transcriptional activator
MGFRAFVLLMTLLASFQTKAQSQAYGLGFESFESVQDKRTGLDLSPEGNFCFKEDFELSFELSFLPDKKNYFGYIVRLIDDNNRNIDILYDNSDAVTHHFKVVTGDRFSTIAFDIAEADLFQKWNRIRLIFNSRQKEIQLISGAKTFRHSFAVKPESCFKILFGATRYKNFNTTDVPAMKIRNVQLTDNGTLKFHWPLDEMKGNKASEIVSHKDGLASNPLWIKKLHYEWQPLRTFTLSGPARITCDQQTGSVFVVGRDTLISYRVATDVVSYVRYPAQSLFMDNQVLYDKSQDKIFNLFINEKQVTTFDFKTRSWDRNVTDSTLKTHFLHANKFFSPKDSSIYMLGGYGHLEYKGNIQKFDLRSNTWSDLSQSDTVFNPRYLAALGRVAGGAYVIGGFGSSTGKQVLNPRNWYDLLYFNAQDHSFRRIYQMETPGEDFVFANSMVVNEKESDYYALIFPKDKFQTEMQLIKGSLKTPEYKAVGSKIPFQFLDTSSYADLFYDNHTSRFVAVTLHKNERNQTLVSIYSLYAPPLQSIAPIRQHAREKSYGLPTISVLLAIAGSIIMLVLIYFKYKKSPKPSGAQTAAFIPVTESVQKQTEPANVQDVNPIPLQNSIFLFGNLQLFDDDGREITKLFTPLLKELFLVLLLYSTRREGISSEKLKELLWFDKTADSARNNRSVNIAKLKAVLEKLKTCVISKQTGYWRLNVNHDVIRIDYAEYLALVSGKRTLNKQEITRLANITKRGSFLSNQEYEWLDSFKSEVSNEIVDAYLRYAASVNIANDPEFLIRLANYIFYFDPVNEEAMILKCKALALLGKHSLAKATLENFAREYSRIYGEEFSKDMPEVLHS